MINQMGFSLYGVINYFNLKEEPLFENITLYTGGVEYDQTIPPIDKDELVFLIEEQCGDLLCYRQIPDRFKKCVENFFKINYENFTKLWIALMMDYNPIENYDRTEDWKDSYNSFHDRTDTTEYHDTNSKDYSGKERETVTPSGTEKHTEAQTGNTITTNQLSADDSETWRNDTKSEVTPPTKTEDTLSFTDRQTQTDKEFFERNDLETFTHYYDQGSDKNEHRGHDDRHGHIHGNIGVLSSQEMIEKSINIAKTNFYQFVTDLFEKQLMLQNY